MLKVFYSTYLKIFTIYILRSPAACSIAIILAEPYELASKIPAIDPRGPNSPVFSVVDTVQAECASDWISVHIQSLLYTIYSGDCISTAVSGGNSEDVCVVQKKLLRKNF